MKKILIGAIALITAAAPIAAAAAPFGHDGRQDQVTNRSDWRGGYRGDYRGDNRGDFRGDNRDGYRSDFRGYRGERDGNGGAAIAGLFGLALGAAVASSYQPAYAQDYGYGYGECGWQTEAVRGPYGQVRYQQVQVCN